MELGYGLDLNSINLEIILGDIILDISSINLDIVSDPFFGILHGEGYIVNEDSSGEATVQQHQIQLLRVGMISIFPYKNCALIYYLN